MPSYDFLNRKHPSYRIFLFCFTRTLVNRTRWKGANADFSCCWLELQVGLIISAEREIASLFSSATEEDKKTVMRQDAIILDDLHIDQVRKLGNLLLGVWERSGTSIAGVLSPACATFFAELCNPITRQATELESCSNSLRIQQVF